MNIIEDTYFLNYNLAYETAKSQNMLNKFDMQICFYDGEEQVSPYKNLIHLPFDNIYNELLLGNYRLPTQLNLEGLSLSHYLKKEIEGSFKMLIDSIIKKQEELIGELVQEIKSEKINFDEPLRICLFANNTTQVMQHTMKDVANAFKKLGYNVLFEVNNELEEMKFYRIVKGIYKFKPHIFFNVNYNFNHLLNDSTFQFIWYQDPSVEIVNNKKIILRDRDIVFSLVELIDYYLHKKNIPFQRQSFCTSLEHKEYNIQREKKIVFIGSAYNHLIKKDSDTLEVLNFLVQWLISGKSFTNDIIDKIVNKFNYDKGYLQSRLLPAVIRDSSVVWLCKIQSNYKIEIYGNGWDKYDDVKPFYKGVLSHGDEVNKIYASATYALAPHQSYVLQTRVFEATLNGAIPIVYDCRDVSDEQDYSEALCYFKTFKDLENILLENNSHNKDFTKLLEENSYEEFAKRIINKVKLKLKDR